MANLLDDLFQWAAQQPPANSVSVKIAMTSITNQESSAGELLVTYSEGTLIYHPPPFPGGSLPGHEASFASPNDGITQYTTQGGAPAGFPFSLADPLTITLNAPTWISVPPPTVLQYQPYTIIISSSKGGWKLGFTPAIDPTTNILTAAVGWILGLLPNPGFPPNQPPTFYTIGLGGRKSSPPPT